MKQRKFWLARHWKKTALLFGAGLLAIGVLTINLTGLTSGQASASERSYHQSTMNLAEIIKNPVNVPLSLTHWLVNQLSTSNLLLARLPSVLFAALTIAVILYVLRKWYGPRTAIFGFFLFTSSAWLLHVGRLATPDILLVWAIPALLAANIFLQEHVKKPVAPFIWLTVQLAVLYVPGMIWFVIINTWFQRHDLLEAYRTLTGWWKRPLLAVSGLIFLAPLVIGLLFGQTKSVALMLLGLPQQVPAISELGRGLLDSLLFIGVRGTAPDELWLNHLPLLSAFLVVGFIAGLAFYGKHWRASRAKMLGIYLILGLLLSSLGGLVNIGVILPMLYLIAAAGIAYLLHLWLGVFPKNPLARAGGITLIALAIGVTCLFGIRQYFVAWPHHPESHAKFNKHI